MNGEKLAFELQVAPGDSAVAQADYDGDCKADLGSYNPASGVWHTFCSASGYQLGSF